MHFQSAYNQYQPLFSNKAILKKIVINIKEYPFNPFNPWLSNFAFLLVVTKFSSSC